MGQLQPIDLKEAPLIIDWPQRQDPMLTPPKPAIIVPQSLHKVWLAALDQPEVQVRVQTMEAITTASKMQIKNLTDIYAAKLRVILDQSQSNNALALAAAKTLIALDDKDASPLLLQRNHSAQIDWVLLTDPVLARWQRIDAVKTWIKRASDTNASWTIRHSALEQLATLHPENAQGPLRQLLGAPSLGPLLKLSTAKALGQIATQGLLGDAQSLVQGDLTSKLTAIACLQSHDSGQVRKFLQSQLQESEPAYVLQVALLLNKIAPQTLAAHSRSLQVHSDASLRLLAATNLIDQITAPRVNQLAPMLGDVHPAIRKTVRDAFIKLGTDKKLSHKIIAVTRKQLVRGNWQEQEQAAYILGKLGVKDSIDALFTVLQDSPHMEVRLACATAIRWLNVSSKREQALQICQGLFDRIKKTHASEHTLVLSQLVQWLGQSKYTPACPLLIKLIPKNSAPSTVREAGIWAIGKMGPTPETNTLTNQLMARIKDLNGMDPEIYDVQIAAMVTLVRLGKFQTLANYFNSSQETIMMMLDMPEIQACQTWATSLSEGKPFVMPTPKPTIASSWFLQPLKMTIQD